MLWFAVWTTLVLATLVGAALLGWRLWRQGKALLRQLHETGEVMERLQTRIEELEALRAPDPELRPGVLADEHDRAHWREVRRSNLERRAQRRRRRHAEAFRRWQRVTG